MNVLEKSLTQPKKPKNKYRRADTTPGLFQDMSAQMDKMFDDCSGSLISKNARANDDMNLITESIMSDANWGYFWKKLLLDFVSTMNPQL